MMTTMDREAAAEFVPVSLEEMDKVIRRGFRAFRPRVEKASWGETLYFLTPDADDPDSVIRVQTSIFTGSQARGDGEDSIRVTILNTKTNRPIAGKFPIVKRTQNWKDNLRQRIEDAVETFEELGEERAKAKQLGNVRQEQEKLRQEQPDDFQVKRAYQIKILEALAASRSRSAGVFADMLQRLRKYGGLLSDRQLAWAEKEYKWIR